VIDWLPDQQLHACHLTDTYDLYIGITASQPYPQSGIAISLFLDPNQSQSLLYPGTHEQHSYGRRPVLVLLTPAKSISRPASLAPRKSIRSSSGSQDVCQIAVSTGTNVCPSIRLETGVGEEGCMVAADVKSKNPGAAPSLRCEIECFKTKADATPDPGSIPHGQGILRGTRADCCHVMFHEARSFNPQSRAVESNSVTSKQTLGRELSSS
jgi:hypothetical protein